MVNLDLGMEHEKEQSTGHNKRLLGVAHPLSSKPSVFSLSLLTVVVVVGGLHSMIPMEGSIFKGKTSLISYYSTVQYCPINS